MPTGQITLPWQRLMRHAHIVVTNFFFTRHKVIDKLHEKILIKKGAKSKIIFPLHYLYLAIMKIEYPFLLAPGSRQVIDLYIFIHVYISLRSFYFHSLFIFDIGSLPWTTIAVILAEQF